MVDVLLYTLVPAVLMALGGGVAYIKIPGPKTTSWVQHFAAGVVFAAVALELLPKVVGQSKWLLSAGFALGVLLMLSVGWLSRFLNQGEGGSRFPLGMVVGVGMDVLIDGILIGVSFLASTRSGIFIAMALALEVLFLGLSTAATMAKRNVSGRSGLLVMVLLAALIPAGAILGFDVVSHMSDAAHLMILSLGVAALLYLVTEELLVEAHKNADHPITALAFFLGFLAILVLA